MTYPSKKVFHSFFNCNGNSAAIAMRDSLHAEEPFVPENKSICLFYFILKDLFDGFKVVTVHIYVLHLCIDMLLPLHMRAFRQEMQFQEPKWDLAPNLAPETFCLTRISSKIS